MEFELLSYYHYSKASLHYITGGLVPFIIGIGWWRDEAHNTAALIYEIKLRIDCSLGLFFLFFAHHKASVGTLTTNFNLVGTASDRARVCDGRGWLCKRCDVSNGKRLTYPFKSESRILLTSCVCIGSSSTQLLLMYSSSTYFMYNHLNIVIIHLVDIGTVYPHLR